MNRLVTLGGVEGSALPVKHLNEVDLFEIGVSEVLFGVLQIRVNIPDLFDRVLELVLVVHSRLLDSLLDLADLSLGLIDRSLKLSGV